MKCMTEKEKYIDEQISYRLQYWISKMLLLGIIYFPFIGLADFFVTPENLKRFMLYRLLVTAVLALAYYLNKRRRNIRYQYVLITVSTLLSAVVIEAMILRFGGHASTYYAGLNLLIIAALGLIPYGFFLSLSVGIAIYLLYLVPILLFDTITSPPVFIVNNIFMISTFVLALTWRALSQKSMINELSLQYDLLQDKKELEKTVTALHKSELWHRSLFENATDGIIVLDRKGMIMNANSKACEMHGYTCESIIGVSIRLLEVEHNTEIMSERMDRILAGESMVFETVHRKQDGAGIPLEVSSKAISIGGELFVQSFYRDITEKKRIQEHLAQSQKMESVGALAGGIAHDFNNILTAILGHTEIARRSEGLDEQAVKSLNIIEEASRRAGRMISKLLGFARKSKYEFLPLNINDIVYDTVKLLERVIDKTNSLSVELDSHVPLIRGDINQLEQVVMNLIVNARDAMPGGGCISIRTAVRTVSKNSPDAPPYVPEGEYVLVSVADTGIGIPEHLKNAVFEPFFTTKERGKGTGLGLSTVYGAVKEHKGYIDVQSEVGAGTMFTVYLPASGVPAPPKGQISATLSGGHETVLIVDDEQEILQSIQGILTGHGYTVLVTGDAAEAVRIFGEKSGEIALVITDIVMPRLDGRELIRRIKITNPGIKILAVSGYTSYVAEKEEIKDINGFLQKPFDADHLLSTVRRILDRKSKDFVAV